MFKSINRVVKFLIYSDFLLSSGFGLVSPIFAIFLVNRIQGGDVKVAGIAAATYWITKSLLQIPIGRYLDKNHGEKDDFYFMIIGVIASSSVPIGYIFSSLPWHIYLLQAVFAFGMAMNVPSWSAIFTRHIDKGKEAFEWSTESTLYGIGAGITGALGGFLASKFGFNAVFIGVSVIVFSAGVLLIFISRNIFLKNKRVPRTPQVLDRGL